MGIICCLAQGCRGLALLCSRDQSELLCQRDKALLCSKHPALFLSFSVLSDENAARCNTRVNKWTDKWTSGWKCRQGDKSIVVCWSIWNKDCFWAAHCWQRKKKSQPYCYFFLLNIAVEIWAETQHNSFSFSAFERCLENAWVLSLSKMNDFPSWKYIVYRPRILHNIKIPCLGSCLKHLSHREKSAAFCNLKLCL